MKIEVRVVVADMALFERVGEVMSDIREWSCSMYLPDGPVPRVGECLMLPGAWIEVVINRVTWRPTLKPSDGRHSALIVHLGPLDRHHLGPNVPALEMLLQAVGFEVKPSTEAVAAAFREGQR